MSENRQGARIMVAAISLLLLLSACQINITKGDYPPFIKAAQQGNISEADKLLRAGAWVNQTTVGNQTALHIAAAEGQDQMVIWLLAREANPIAQDQNSKTPAEYAKAQGHRNTEKIILDYIQLLTSEEEATATGDVETLSKLLTQDVRQYTLLHILAQHGATQEAEKEIQSGADVNARTALGLTPLHKAVVSGKVELAQLLLDAGADINARDIYNDTPLYYAVSLNNKSLVELFLKTGADTSIRSIHGNETPLEVAKRESYTEIINLLQQH